MILIIHTLSSPGSAGERVCFEFDGCVRVLEGLQARKGGGMVVFPHVRRHVLLQYTQMLEKYVHLGIWVKHDVAEKERGGVKREA